jgi:DNA-directed RNA polymerase specialized sigma24 family protein
VKESAVQHESAKGQWLLSQPAFHGLLGWLDEDEDSGGQRYLEMRQRLALYFDRKNCLSPDELVDETLNRVARRLEEEGTIESDTPAHYCYIVARFVFLEHLRKQEREVSLDESSYRDATRLAAAPDASEEQQEKERRGECLERCARQLEPEQRALIMRYYTGEHRAKIENRKAMAVEMGVTVNALSIRACRIRDKLEACVRKCLDH